jgi:hypothetical protein
MDGDRRTDAELVAAVLAALQALPPATRKAVIGFYLQGYSYQELAELLDLPLSTVRGRLYHGRRRLRRTLRPLADELLTPTPTQQEEHRMDTTALLDADVAFVGRLAFSTDCVVMLQERGGPRQLALEPVDAATGDVVERLLGGDQPLAPTTHDLLPRPSDRQQQDLHEELELTRLRRRLAERAGPHRHRRSRPRR